jgi:2,3-bisphosphoglycerate-dependent phosphoglycerate mutase
LRKRAKAEAANPFIK